VTSQPPPLLEVVAKTATATAPNGLCGAQGRACRIISWRGVVAPAHFFVVICHEEVPKDCGHRGARALLAWRRGATRWCGGQFRTRPAAARFVVCRYRQLPPNPTPHGGPLSKQRSKAVAAQLQLTATSQPGCPATTTQKISSPAMDGTPSLAGRSRPRPRPGPSHKPNAMRILTVHARLVNREPAAPTNTPRPRTDLIDGRRTFFVTPGERPAGNERPPPGRARWGTSTMAI